MDEDHDEAESAWVLEGLGVLNARVDGERIGGEAEGSRVRQLYQHAKYTKGSVFHHPSFGSLRREIKSWALVQCLIESDLKRQVGSKRTSSNQQNCLPASDLPIQIYLSPCPCPCPCPSALRFRSLTSNLNLTLGIGLTYSPLASLPRI